MTDWLADTLLWTAILITVVLLVRRPVARWFGPQIAYALWALPMLRLLLPPIELPGWLAPDAGIAASEASVQPTSFLIPDSAANVATPEAVASPVTGSGMAAPGETTSWTLQSLFELAPLLDLALLVWLAGAAVFVYARFGAYFRLRADLLGDAREVGRAGKVRLIESPATAAPLAFGVVDKVIALPPGFMALPDRTGRDLALAHELAHHSGRDLAINVAVQPLFALHWWNPLGRYGWLALRRDQEAACDARVMASKPAETRAAYAKVIAGFAAGPNLALAAPMACPVLGEKSIIQRLRSLKMSDTSPRRRLAGRALLGAAALALPLTASVTYAEAIAPAAPVPPASPAMSLAPPAPPAPPLAPLSQQIVTIDPDDIDAEPSGDEESETYVIRREIDGEGNGVTERRIERVRTVTRTETTDEDIEEMMKGVRAGLAEADKAIKDIPNIVRRAMVEIDQESADGKRTIVKMKCDGDGVATVKEGKTREVFICQSKIMAEALNGLKEAREDIASDSEIDASIREKLLEELDRQIATWRKQAG